MKVFARGYDNYNRYDGPTNNPDKIVEQYKHDGLLLLIEVCSDDLDCERILVRDPVTREWQEREI